MVKDQLASLIIVDGTQYANYSKNVFLQLKEAGVTAVNVTVCYHENFRETVSNLIQWNRWFELYPDLIFLGREAKDILKAQETQRTAIFFGTQNVSLIESDIGLIEICHQLGIRSMQLTYNNQSLLASGCYEKRDHGISRMGLEVIKEMNRVGIIVDMAHSAEKSTLEAIEISKRPIMVSHATPDFWCDSKRSKSNQVLKELASSGGMFGFSLYAFHLKGGGQCSLEEFTTVIARTVELMGIDSIGIGSDLCLGQSDEVLKWLRNGKWTRKIDYGEGSEAQPGFPAQPSWFQDNFGFGNLVKGLKKVGFSEQEVRKIMGLNWLNFYIQSFKKNN